MRYYSWILIAIFMLCASAALAQDAGDPLGPGQPGETPDRKVITGSITQVDAAHQSYTIALRLKVDDPNTPGKVPDELAQKAAQLSDELKQAEKNGNEQRAARLRRLIAELLCWREVQRTITPADRVILVGTRRVPMKALAAGMRVGLALRVEAALPDGQVPPNATLIGDVAILNGLETKTFVRRQGVMPNKPVTFLHVVGYVVNTQPLTVRVQNALIKVDVAPQFNALQNVAITAKELQPGQSVFAQVQLRNGAEVTRVNYINALFYEPKTPFPGGDNNVR